MTDLLTAAQMRAIEAAAIASGEVTGLELMERAGRGVVEAVFAEWPELAAGSFRAVVLCGPGGNGGDGFVVARLLKEWGWEVFLHTQDYDDLNNRRFRGGECGAMARAWVDAGGMGRPLSRESLANAMDTKDTVVLVDALLGIGQVRSADNLLSPVNSAWDFLSNVGFWADVRCVALDVPTGLDADTGQPTGECAFEADLTVSFHRGKIGHYLGEGPRWSGRLVLAEIGLPKRAGSALRLCDIPDGLGKGPGHKFSHGHALILSGPPGHGGAARLAARGALRIGAGVVTLAVPPEALAENAARLDAVMLRVVADAEGLREVLADARITALCLGPGLGLDDRAAGLVRVVLETSGSRVGPGTARSLRVVLDADALTLLARDAALFGLLHENCILTPHGGEFARLFADIAARLEAPALTGPAYSKVDACREAAARAGCVVLFKGADTVIAAPDGTCAINAAAYDRAAPWLATAGSGDVLAGFICGLLARGFTPMQAAETAAWLHVECARSFGPGLIAEDLSEELPKVFRTLGV